MSEAPSLELQELARYYGVRVEYVGMSGRIEQAPASSLLAVLRALGASLATEADVPLALLERKLSYCRQRVEPVVVAWDGACPTIEVRLPEALASSTVRCRLAMESGEVREWSATVDASRGMETPEGFAFGNIQLSGYFPTGYHQLELRFEDGRDFGSIVVSAPTRA
jgi:hypothetical protein